MSERFEMLIRYLGELRMLNEDDNYICTEEIKECISEIRDVLQVENRVPMANKPVWMDECGLPTTIPPDVIKEHERFMKNNPPKK